MLLPILLTIIATKQVDACNHTVNHNSNHTEVDNLMWHKKWIFKLNVPFLLGKKGTILHVNCTLNMYTPHLNPQ